MTNLRLVQVNDVRVAVGLEAFGAPLAADAALLLGRNVSNDLDR